MVGNRVIVYYVGGKRFEGVLLKMNREGVVVESISSIADYREKKFIPFANISEILDRGRAP